LEFNFTIVAFPMSQSLPCTRDEQSSDYVITAVPANLPHIGDTDQ